MKTVRAAVFLIMGLAIGAPGHAGDLTTDDVTVNGTMVVQKQELPEEASCFYTFDVNEGAIVTDQSGSGNTGIINGSPVYTESGKIDGAYDYDGIDDYIDMSGGSVNNFPSWSVYTICVWFYNDGGGDLGNGYGQKILDRTVYYHDFYLSVLSSYDGRLRFFMYESGGTALDDLSHDYRDSTWHHAVVVRNGSYGELWVDGVKKSTSTTMRSVYYPPPYGPGALQVGASASTDGFQKKEWSGMLDQLVIYDRALTESEITDAYNFAGEPTPEAGTVRFEEGVIYTAPLGDIPMGSHTNAQ